MFNAPVERKRTINIHNDMPSVVTFKARVLRLNEAIENQ